MSSWDDMNAFWWLPILYIKAAVPWEAVLGRMFGFLDLPRRRLAFAVAAVLCSFGVYAVHGILDQDYLRVAYTPPS